MDPEPPRPQWLVQSDLLTAAVALSNAESAEDGRAESDNTTSENAANILLRLMDNLQEILPEVRPANLSCCSCASMSCYNLNACIDL